MMQSNSTMKNPEAATDAQITTVKRVESDPAEMANKILDILLIYDRSGIASRDGLRDAPAEYHPHNIMPDFRSIIILAHEPRNVSKEDVSGTFHDVIGKISAQNSVIKYLRNKGYKSQVIGSRANTVSLPRLGERAGVGELSPVNTLAVKGHGLRTVLSAIITDAPLPSSPRVYDACPRRDACLRRCPALGIDGRFDRKKCTSCGTCVKTCPVE